MENNKEIIFEEWKTCVEMANSISTRRDQLNNIMCTINLGFITAAIAISNFKGQAFSIILMCIISMMLNYIWLKLINNFKNLNKEKFKVIFELEDQLPYAPFKKEWDYLQLNKSYMDGTKIEYFIPIIFIVISFIALIVMITISFICK